MTPALTVTEDTGNTRVAGDRVRFRVTLTTPGGVNVSTFVLRSLLSISGGGCIYTVANGSLSDNFSGSYVLCESLNPPVGPLSVMVSFCWQCRLAGCQHARQRSLSPAAPCCAAVPTCRAPPSARRRRGQLLRPHLCRGQRQLRVGVFRAGWRVRARFSLFRRRARLSSSSRLHCVPVTPPALSTCQGPTSQFYQSYACMRDVDGDGATLAHTDGVLVLRRMFGLTGNALTEAPRTPAFRVRPPALCRRFRLPRHRWRQPDARRDGWSSVLRAMLGFRGER